MARKNMHCALQRSFSDIQNDTERGNHCLFSESSEQHNLNASSKDCEVSSVVWRNSNHRGSALTFFTLEPNGQWRIVALPLQCTDHTIHVGSAYGINMNGPRLICPSSISSLNAVRHKARKEPATNRSSVKSLTARSLSALSSHHQSRNKILPNKVSKQNGLLEDKAGKTNSRKKRKKGKRNKKLSQDTGLTELECAQGSSTSETGEVQDTHSRPINCYDDPHSNFYSEANNDLVLDSVSLGSNSDTSFNADEEIDGNVLLKSPADIVRKRDFSPGSMLNDVVDSNSPAERANCGKQGCTNDEKHTDGLEKREKQIKRVPKTSSAYRASGFGNSHGRFGKENNHSVWQKVQRNDGDECKCDSTKLNSAYSQFDTGFKEASVLKKHPNAVDSNMLSNSADTSQTKVKVSVQLKRKTSPGSKHVYKYYSRKVSHAIKAQSNLCTRITMKHNDISDSSTPTSGPKDLDTVSRSHSKIGYRRIGFQSKRVESIKFKPIHGSQLCPSELKPLGSVYSTVSSSIDQNAENQTRSFSRSWDPLDPPELLKDLSAVHLHTLVDDEVTKVDKEVSPPDLGNQATISEPIIQKWIPVGVKDSGMPSLGQPRGFSVPMLNEPSGEKRTSQNTSEEDFASESNDQNVSASENDLSPIVCAVNDARRAQLASEAIQMATGFPIAEFEKFLHSASPVVCKSYKIINCQTCSPDRVIGSSLCRHETSDISLGRLWKWYEKRGSYGLEVRAEDCGSSKRLGVDLVPFHAFFVPYLSAVQVFRKRKDRHKNNGNGNTSTQAKTLKKSSNIGHLPIFSVLVPQPQTAELSYLAPENRVCGTDAPSLMHSEDSSEDDLELLFEYFESEQPQKRPPLFEMIKELVRGERPSQRRTYGDATILDSMGVHDLHPNSWYSVAWYPIYRIPDGNFRAAFLTYHSLGHLVYRGSTSDSRCEDACIVSPVVGLQSYNSQGEGWFQSWHSANSQIAESLNINPAEILKDRLSTLEQTASLMARSVVTKGGQRYMNRQPDYEFFLSRRRW